MSARQPRNTAASVKQRLLNLAMERGEDFNFLLTRFAVERLLYRLDQSSYGNQFVLKGAMLFHLRSGTLPHRPTRDVDFLGRGDPTPTRLERVFRGICRVQVADDGLIFDEQSVRAERIREEQEYEGVRIKVKGRMGSARIPVQIDVGFGDALTPPPKREPLATLLDFPAPCLLICPWETVIAEKFQTLVDRGMANSRMRDFFDLHYFAATLSFDGATCAAAIQATFKRRRTPLPVEVPAGLSPAFGADPLKQTQWRAFIGRLRLGTEKRSLGWVLEGLRAFLMPPVEALTQKQPFQMTWSPRGPWNVKR
ncbi:MAG: nucleotidyl transferase AbiEii/AbiGii toxin family protein [Candidatus Omnitrophica bacterium]|nr:nucleotidyl transferase AbiEii/AbiGii toxin family protein [Candidatus Omnitrophota bacterium]MBI3082883.1 nucleotidyl transferase AbiEii/AbiGii toxin family protein [Candidatus Omnitrophota bacterium]